MNFINNAQEYGGANADRYVAEADSSGLCILLAIDLFGKFPFLQKLTGR